MAKRRAGGFSLGMSQRLGIAAALLGDPAVLMFDEPVNGLDPEGIVWVRQLMRALAAEGRTVFVSSHLMSEMALTADHLVVIGQGRLIADTSVSDFIESSSEQSVRVESPQVDALADRLRQQGATVRPAVEGGIEVVGHGERRHRGPGRSRGLRPAPAGHSAGFLGGGVHGADPRQRRVPRRVRHPKGPARDCGDGSLPSRWRRAAP